MESYIITDGQIAYSSGNVIASGPRLNTNGQWSAGSQDSNQWLQISLFRQTNITGVVLMGHYSYNYYVSRYRVEFCLDGVSWDNVTDQSGDAEVFSFPCLFVCLFVCLCVCVFLSFFLSLFLFVCLFVFEKLHKKNFHSKLQF